MTVNRVRVFDCDGVLLDSNAMKTKGFAAILSAYDPAAVASFVAYQKTAFGTSRFRLIDRFFADYLGRAPEPGESDGLLRDFGRYCRASYPSQPVTPGANGLLSQLCAQGETLYVASGSAEAELREVLANIGLAPYFAQIFGSPRTKIDILTDIRALHPSAEICFFGDAKADFEAARALEVPFVYVSGFAADAAGMAALQGEHGFVEIPNLAALEPAAWPPRARSTDL